MFSFSSAIIHTTNIIVSNEKLIISDGNQDFIVELNCLDNVEIREFTIILNLDYDVIITLDY